jgi:hypothetical protein
MIILQADAIVEAKLKMTDVSCALMLCSLVHQRYSDFSGLLLESWQKVMLTKKDDKVFYTLLCEVAVCQFLLVCHECSRVC